MRKITINKTIISFRSALLTLLFVTTNSVQAQEYRETPPLTFRPLLQELGTELIQGKKDVFGYKQLFPLYVGVNAIGRRNKDTATDIPIITSDPSMDRHHAIIKVTEGRTGKLRFAVADDDSRVGTFLAGELLAPKEWRYLQPGDVLTLGATSIIFSDEPLPEDPTIEES